MVPEKLLDVFWYITRSEDHHGFRLLSETCTIHALDLVEEEVGGAKEAGMGCVFVYLYRQAGISISKGTQVQDILQSSTVARFPCVDQEILVGGTQEWRCDCNVVRRGDGRGMRGCDLERRCIGDSHTACHKL